VNRLVRAVALVLAASFLLAGNAACGSGSEPDPDAVAVPDSIPTHQGPRDRLEGFEEVTVTVVTEDGRTFEWCLLLAETPQSQQQGLMHVTDPALGGYDGMLFLFSADGTGGFWMRNTRLPLSIAYLDGEGAIVSTHDMEPCPDTTERCPSYPPGGSYRMAIEVVQGRLAELGIEGDARVTVGEKRCAPLDGAATGGTTT
jgi:uncharacterized membrane protein (UPF0127 family)